MEGLQVDLLPDSPGLVTTTFVERSLRKNKATVHSCRRRVEAWYYPHILSRQCCRQEGVRSLHRTLQETHALSHIWSVRLSFLRTTAVIVVTNVVQYRLDPVQVTQMAKYLETVYVSGWQSSSTASSTNEPGPDLAGAYA